MSDNIKKVVEDKPKTPESFVKAYQSLCEAYGYRIVVNPAWITRDDGSWSTVLQTSVGKLLAKEQS